MTREGRRTVWLLCLVLWFAVGEWALGQRYATRSFRQRDGLPASSAVSITGLPDGSVMALSGANLVVCRGGLWSIVHEDMTSLMIEPSHFAVDSKGNPWLAGRSVDDGLLWRSGSSFVRVRGFGFHRLVRQMLVWERPGVPAVGIVITRSRNVVLVSEGGIEDLPFRGIERMLLVDEGVLLVGATGVLLLKPDLSSESVVDSEVVGARSLVAALPRTAGGFWLITESVLFQHEESRTQEVAYYRTSAAFGSDSLIHACEDGNGGLFFGDAVNAFHYEGEGVYPANLDTKTGFVSTGTTGIAVDSRGYFWFSQLRGVTCCFGTRVQQWSEENGLPDAEVTAATEWEGTIVVACGGQFCFFDPGGISTVPLPTTSWKPATPLRILELAPGLDGNLYATVDKLGLVRLNRDRKVDVLVGGWPHPCSLLVEPDGSLLVGTMYGMASFSDDAGLEVRPTWLRSVRRILRLSDGTLVVAAHHVGVRIGEGPKAVEFASTGLERTTNVSTAVLHRGQILLGTEGGVAFVKGRSLVPWPLPTTSVPLDRPVFGLLSDRSGRLWIGTDRGVIVVNPSGEAATGDELGLTGMEVNRGAFFEDSRGDIWIGSTVGVACIRVGKRAPEPVVPILDLRRAALGGNRRVQDEGEPSRLVAPMDALFEFRGMSLLESDMEFRFRLRGYESDWRSLVGGTSGSQSYTSLPAGRYQFLVQARHLEGEWSAITSSREFEVGRPFLGSWESFALLASVLLLARLLIGRYRSMRTMVSESTSLLAEVKRNYEDLFQVHPVPQLLVDAETDHILLANDSAQEMLRSTSEDLGQARFSDLFEWEGGEDAWYPKGFDRPAQFTVSYRDANGNLRHLQVAAHTGAILGHRSTHVILQDITDFVRVRAELSHSQQLLMLGQLARGVAHDFGNLMMIISGAADLIDQELTAPSPARDRSQEIQHAARRGRDLVQRLLAYARHQKLHPNAFSVREMIQEIVPMLGSALTSQIQLTMDFQARPDYVMADKAELERVFLNLVLNARDAMPAGGSLRVQTLSRVFREGHPVNPTLAPGEYVVCSMEDSGVGMTEEVRVRVFEPFFTTKGADRAGGLGLASAKGVLQQLGGDICVESQRGRGSTFHIYLPAASLLPVPAANAPTAEKRFSLAGRPILLVEDEPAIRRILQMRLEGLGLVVLAAQDGQAALDLCSDREMPQILLTDVMVPRIDGPELARRLRKSDQRLAVVVMSGYGELDVQLCDSLPNVVFLSKPFSAKELEAALCEALHLAKASANPALPPAP